jgi:hypothetical protein
LTRRGLPGLVAAGILLAALPVRADAAQVGIRGGYYADAGRPFLGAEVAFRLAERAQLAPSLEVLDVDDGHFVNASVDVLYDLSCACNAASQVWAGAGVAAISRDDGSESTVKPGLGLLLGFGFRAGRVMPYTQVKGILKDRPDVAFAIGLRF